MFRLHQLVPTTALRAARARSTLTKLSLVVAVQVIPSSLMIDTRQPGVSDQRAKALGISSQGVPGIAACLDDGVIVLE